MDLIVTLQCKDQPGIVHAMTTAVLGAQGNIIENQQFTDPITQDFVMRTRFESELDLVKVREILENGLAQFKPKLLLRSVAKQKKALILVTKESHCLRDLLYLQELGELPIEIPAVISNHSDLKGLVESHGIKFIDQSKLTKSEAEAEIVKFVAELEIDLVVLARYMQILSKEFCQNMFGRIINIHHSFLPGFKGAKPYHQAHARGVKIIGATAHFVTPDLDEGPIIDQDVAHVTHASTPEDLIATGRDIERRVLSRAVRDFAEDRIFIVGDKTVVFHN
ncbi:MAG: formyltetrahydrofolate deformylase [Candidatus Nanopelagicaceae bacterium]